MKTYVYRVFVEADKDQWWAYCPALEKYGAITWADSREEALESISDIVEMALDSLAEGGLPIPEGLQGEAAAPDELRVAVTI